MSKYQALASHLDRLAVDHWTATFIEVERVLGFSLPGSARQHRPWWANQTTSGHSQTHGWMPVGWQTERVSIEDEIVTFVRDTSTGASSGGKLPPTKSQLDAPSGGSGMGMSIAQAKLELSKYYDTAPENIEIVIRG
jgi:hypothetical protein